MTDIHRVLAGDGHPAEDASIDDAVRYACQGRAGAHRMAQRRRLVWHLP